MDPQSAVPTDEAWLAALRATPPDETAVAALRERLGRGLERAFADRADVDFAQEATMRVLERLDSFRGESRFATWATAVAIRVAFTRLRRRRWGERSLEGLGTRAGDAVASGRAPDPSAASARDDVVTALRAAIDRDLTAKQRTVVLALLAGAPTSAIAEQMGTNRNALHKLFHDARRKLRAALEQAGFSEDDVRDAGAAASPG
jgi:RNA polymerase sigma-70 factor (ECF subfamily)